MCPPVKKYDENKGETPFVRAAVVGTIRFLNLQVERYEQAGLFDFQSKFYSLSRNIFFKCLPRLIFLSVFNHYSHARAIDRKTSVEGGYH